MGAEPYQYFVAYEPNLQGALDKLRERVFASGEFHGADRSPATPEQALELAGEDGTRSILDIATISETPDFFCAASFAKEMLAEWFGTTEPTLGQVENCPDIWEEIDRGQARYVIIYEFGAPRQICFLGYSFD